MSCKVEKLEGGMARLTIETPYEEFVKATDKAYQQSKNKISVPGFRKGKVPKNMIEKMYGKTVFFEDAANIIIPEAYEKAVTECGEEIVSQPKIEVLPVKEGEPFVFTAEVALEPEITLGAYKGVKIDKVETEATDEEVDKQIKLERENSAREINVTDRPVKDGDSTILDFEGFVDGVAFEGGKGENYPLTIGSGAFIPGFEEQLVGAVIGEEKEVNVTFPEDYQAENLKGKAAVFKCTIKEIKEKELPELDDEFASEVSEYDTFEEYKESIRKGITAKKTEDAKAKREDAVIEAIIADSKMEIPEAMVTTEQRRMLDDYASRLQMQGLSMEQYMKYTGATEEMFLEQMKPQAEKRIKSRLVLKAVVKAENFDVTDEEYNKEVERLAEIYQMEVERVKELLDEKAKKEVITDLKIQKAVDFVVENAKEGK